MILHSIRRVARALGTGISITVFVAIAFCLLAWFVGPYLPLLASPLSRLITIAIIILLSLFVILLVILRRAKRAKNMEDDIVESVDDTAEDDELVQAELVEMKGKMRDALTALRKSKLGRRSLYELPWYVIIGPPGAGKTTALVNSGLNFPLAKTTGSASIGGVGGTRNCDWWFTNDAVLIDTAGRYTTQDSEESEDNAGWLGFLKMLKKNRKRQPINGAIVAVSLSDLSLQDEASQKSHAAAIRRRLHELREKLGVRFPVYIMFTKSDLIAGFTEFYDNMGKEEREQVWGFTLPLPKKTKGELSPVAAFDEEFSLLLGQLNSQSLERMQQETDHQRRALISSFPSQFASVRTTARSFLGEVFQDNRFEKRHLLRGVYFASGTQEGTPIDRLMMGMARTFGIGRQAIGTGRGTGRSFFLTRLFEGVMFPEAGLVSADDKVERRYRWTKYIAITAAVIGGIGMTAVWARSYLGNAALLAQATESVDTYRAQASDIPSGPIQDSDLPGIVPALDTLRGLPANPAAGDPDPERALTFGLYQGKVVGNQASQSYRAALNEHLLPRLLLRLEEQMQANMNNADFLYESLKIYLMLGQQGPMNTALIKEWMELDWSVAYQGSGRDALRTSLTQHLETMLDAPLDEIALNGPLVEQIQGLLSEMPLAQRVYNSIINAPRAKALPQWRLTDIGGPAISRVIVRSSGKQLNEGIEGIFTYEGFNDVFLDEALGVAQRLQSESWVLGERGASEQTETALIAMSRDVLDLYYSDYISRYDQILGDIDIIPLESLSHAVEVTNVLSGPTSPLVNILKAVASETRLTEERSTLGVDTSGLQQGASDVAAIELQSTLSSRSQLLLRALSQGVTESGEQGPPPKKPGEFVEERFEWLQTLVAGQEGQPSQLDELMARLTEVYQELNKLSFAGGAGAGAGEASAIVRFQELANRLPGPIQRWSTQVSSGSSGIAADGTRSSINAQWQSQVLPFCGQALDNRYPFTRGAKADVAMGDFSRLFAPNGLIDGFFNDNLRDYVDTSARPWAWKRVNDTDLGISPAVLQQFQYAAEIRDAFFAGAANPAITFQITPEALAPDALDVTLDIDGTEVKYAHTVAPKPTAVTWPGAVGSARIVMQPPVNNNTNAITRDGPWAWFRLLSAAEVRRTNVSDRNRVVFKIGSRFAIFTLQSGSVLNPFALPAMGKFSCPKSF
ncbi:MAG: type VI secretion system membrane subunit TssM [Tateyamaria sp.]|uniref:type VI secretion system membrane subunit TssM n=2 Tax=Tateyamaria sp. TaxID=1929288 RepID=UPI003275293F